MKHQGEHQEQCQSCFRLHHKKTQTKHGGRYSRLYRTWIAIRSRCNNKNSDKYKWYGARGITICKDWEDFSVFRSWSLESGYSKDLTIDRRDNDGNYEPSNCQFIPNVVNAGKDKIKVSFETFNKIREKITSGMSVETAYKTCGINKTAYYNAKERYAKV